MSRQSIDIKRVPLSTFRDSTPPHTHTHLRDKIGFPVFELFTSPTPHPALSSNLIVSPFSFLYNFFHTHGGLNFTRRDAFLFILSFFLATITKRKRRKETTRPKRMFILMLCILIEFMSCKSMHFIHALHRVL